MIEKPIRSIVKTISWRITGTIDTIMVAWLITGKLPLAMSIGFVEVFTKLMLYYLHERTWNKINFGRKQIDEPEYHI